MHERRKYIRSNGLVLVNYRVPSLQLESKSSAFDVSGSGVRITVEKELKPDSIVEMEIFLPGDSQPILAKGKIVWSERCTEKLDMRISPKKEYFYVGVEFTTIDDNNKNRIVNYVYRKLHYGYRSR